MATIAELEAKFAKLTQHSQDTLIKCYYRKVQRESPPDRIGMTGDYRYSVSDDGVSVYQTRTVNILIGQGFVEVGPDNYVVPIKELQDYLDSMED